MPHTRQIDTTELVALSAAECLRLLASTPLGRLVFTEHGLPAVRPVTYLLDDDTIVFTSTEGNNHTAASGSQPIPLAIEHLDGRRLG